MTTDRFTIAHSKNLWSVMDARTGWCWQNLPSKDRAQDLISFLRQNVDHPKYPHKFADYDTLVACGFDVSELE
jgi:hypothetical protein